VRILKFDMPKGAYMIIPDPVTVEEVCKLTAQEIVRFLTIAKKRNRP
jgi:hypothetical protein